MGYGLWVRPIFGMGEVLLTLFEWACLIQKRRKALVEQDVNVEDELWVWELEFHLACSCGE